MKEWIANSQRGYDILVAKRNCVQPQQLLGKCKLKSQYDTSIDLPKWLK